MTELVLVELEEGIGELVLNRPARRNSLIGPMVNELAEGLRSLSSNADCNVIIIRGNEGYFCAGLDLKAFAEDPPPAWRAHFNSDWLNFHNDIFNCPKPVLGALEGFAIAGGSALAFACDFLVVGKNSFLHVAEVEKGLKAPINTAWLSIRFSYACALKILVQGQRYYGDELVDLGIADRCVEEVDVLQATRELGRRLSGFDPGVVQSMKRSLCRAKGLDNFLTIVEKISR